MLNREKLLAALDKPDDRRFLARVLDRFEAVLRHQGYEVTDFCDPYQQTLTDRAVGRLAEPGFEWRGGYQAAERRRLVIFPEYLDPATLDDGTVLLEITGNFRFQRVTHRDFLGALLSLGIKREKLGDIIVTGDGCQVFADAGVKDYITWNLDKIHRVTVRVKEITSDKLCLPEVQAREIAATVSSLRLDAVTGAGFGVSRTRMAGEIASEKVRLNWFVNKDTAAEVKAGDVISCRGLGRLEVSAVGGVTKKGRISITIKRYQ